MTITCMINGQDTSDVDRLKNMEYMKFANGVDCNDENTSFLEQRICLNLEFQRLDKEMNSLFYDLLCEISSTAEIYLARMEQDKWVVDRRQQSSIASEGYRGHHLGIVYLEKMNELTKLRLKKLKRMLARSGQ